MTGFWDEQEDLAFDSVSFSEKVDQLIESFIPKFLWLIKKFIIFHLVFFVLITLELLTIFFYLPEIVQSAFLAAAIGLLFLTVFCYFTLRLYLETKKPEKLKECRDFYLSSCNKIISFNEASIEYHLAIANAATQCALALQGKERSCYSFRGLFGFLDPSMQRLSLFCHGYDICFMRELLLLASVEAHIRLVRLAPTDLEVHAGLANAYVVLSGLYLNPCQESEIEPNKSLFIEKMKGFFKKKFHVTAERAIEEFKILNDYAPHDPWVHLQLGFSYHDLDMPLEEIREYEAVVELCPEDKDSLFKLGMLYFEQGYNAKGLQVYEELQQCNYGKSEELIALYGMQA